MYGCLWTFTIVKTSLHVFTNPGDIFNKMSVASSVELAPSTLSKYFIANNFLNAPQNRMGVEFFVLPQQFLICSKKKSIPSWLRFRVTTYLKPLTRKIFHNPKIDFMVSPSKNKFELFGNNFSKTYDFFSKVLLVTKIENLMMWIWRKKKNIFKGTTYQFLKISFKETPIKVSVIIEY